MTATILQFPVTQAAKAPVKGDTAARHLSPAFALGGIESASDVQPVAPVASIPAIGKNVSCNNWDSLQPQSLYDSRGRCIGTLVPRATQAQLGHGIQGWSKPDKETRID